MLANNKGPATLYKIGQRTFAQGTLMSSLNPDMNKNIRVMATPEWPVPYHQRAFRHPPSTERLGANVSHFLVPIHDMHALIAKEQLKTIGKGYVVEAMEHHFDLSSYRTKFEDCKEFCEAYVDDMLDCIDIVAKQNAKLLDEHDLGDCLR